MTMIQRLLSMIALLTLAACGGGGGSSGTPTFGGGTGGGGGGGGGTPPSVAYLDVRLSSPTLINTGTATVQATVTALDANRSALPGVPVTLGVDSGVLTVLGSVGSVTGDNGQLLASIATGADTSTRTIRLTAAVGTVQGSTSLSVIESPAGATPTSVEIVAAATTVGTGGDAVLIRAFVKDARNNALANSDVTFSTDTGTLSNIARNTDVGGMASAELASGANRSNRTATVTVSSGGITNTLTLPITGTKLALQGPSSLVLANSATFDIVATDSKGNLIPGVEVTATSSLNNTVTAVGNNRSDAEGKVQFRYTAANAGTDTLVFRGGGTAVQPLAALSISGEDFAFVAPAAASTIFVNAPTPVRVQLKVGGNPVANQEILFTTTGGNLSPASVRTGADGIAETSLSSLSAGPVTVQASVAGGTASATLPLAILAKDPSKLVLQVSPASVAPLGTAQVVAKVTDATGNPVQGVAVNFRRDQDPSGGNLLQASNTTDGSGQASVTYRAGPESTSNDGVKLNAVVASTPGVNGSTSLTVNQAALFIALGTGNVIQNLDQQTYQKDWVVYVTDSNGIPVNGVTLTIKAIPTHYRTGRLEWVETAYVYASGVMRCRSEDADQNGILGDREDDNQDKVLWPGNVISVTPGTVQTANGRSTISLIYAESYAMWVDIKLIASATVAGTESSTTAEFFVTGSAPDFSIRANPPAALHSPFGLRPRDGAVCQPRP